MLKNLHKLLTMLKAFFLDVLAKLAKSETSTCLDFLDVVKFSNRTRFDSKIPLSSNVLNLLRNLVSEGFNERLWFNCVV